MRIRFRPLKIDWYVFSEILGPFIGGIIFFTFVFLMFQILKFTDFLIVHNIPATLVGKLAGLLIISFLPITIPVGFLIAILVGFGRLSSDSELVAMKAMGLSMKRLLVAPFALGAIVVVLSLALNLEWVPWGERTLKPTLVRIGNTKITSSLSEGTFTTGFFDLLIYTDKLDAKTNRMQRVFIYDEREPKNPLTVVAKEGEMLPVKGTEGLEGNATQKLGASAVLQLYDGNIHRTEPTSDEYQRIDFSEYELFLKIFEGDDSFVVKAKTLSFSTLLAERAKYARSEEKFREYNTEVWKRLSVATSAIPFIFLGMGFGTVRTRAVRAGAALVAFVVLLFYWILQVAGTSLSNKGVLPAEIAMQLPNFLLLVIGLYAFRKASW